MQNTRLDFIIDYSAVVHANSKGLTLIMNHFLIILNLFDLILSFNQIVRIFLIMIWSIIFVEMIFFISFSLISDINFISYDFSSYPFTFCWFIYSLFFVKWFLTWWFFCLTIFFLTSFSLCFNWFFSFIFSVKRLHICLVELIAALLL